jgi:hypothetical protein
LTQHLAYRLILCWVRYWRQLQQRQQLQQQQQSFSLWLLLLLVSPVLAVYVQIILFRLRCAVAAWQLAVLVGL